MNKKRCVLQYVLGLLYGVGLHAVCTSPTSGIRVWNVAATALETIITIDSEIDLISATVYNGFSGTFSVYEQIASKVSLSDLSVEQVDSSFDQLIEILPDTFSKLSVVESKMALLISRLDDVSVDLLGTFTALYDMQTTICSKLDQLSIDLEQIEGEVIVLIDSEIDGAATIASQLSILSADVDILNSALDSSMFVGVVKGIESSFDMLTSLVDIMHADTDILQSTLEQGFVGIFSSLDAQLVQACTIESLIDAIHPIDMTDLSGVFTALNELQQTIYTMGSIVDIISLTNARNSAFTAESNIDIAVSKLSLAEQEVVLLPSLTDHTISVMEFIEMFSSMVDKTVDKAVSVLDVIEHQTDSIASKVSDLTMNIQTNIGNLEIIDQGLRSIESNVDAIHVTTSKLDSINSKVDLLLDETLTIASLVDQIDVEVTNTVILQAEQLLSKLSLIEFTTQTIASTVDVLIASLDITENKVDSSLDQAQSNIEGLLTIESRIDAIAPQFPIDTINSKLTIIEDITSTIESKLDNMLSLIDLLNPQAQELIGDFQETWTILDTIEQTLCTAQATLDDITKRLDITGVFTVIDSTLHKEDSANSKLNVLSVLVSGVSSKQESFAVQFVGIFTALDNLFKMVSTVESKADHLKADFIGVYGVPINAVDLPLTITTSDRYFLSENINYSTTFTAITIQVDNVILDLDNYTLKYTGTAADIVGVAIQNSNVQVFNGSILGFATPWSVAANVHDIIIKNVYVSGNAIFNTAYNSIVSDCTFGNGSFLLSGPQNIKIVDCFFSEEQMGLHVNDAGATNIDIEGCIFTDNAALNINGPSSNLVVQSGHFMGAVSSAMNVGTASFDNMVCTDCIIQNAASNGIDFNGSMLTNNRGVFLRNNIADCGGVGIYAGGSNNYFGFNALIENSINVQEDASRGPNTYLGNFAFNSTAVGNPNNTNYTISGNSNITGKFATASQTGSFGDSPTEWHNINMLP